METTLATSTKFATDPRHEILEHGLVVDELLASEPDAAVFGFNLACAYPFPEAAARAYRPIAERLGKLDPAVYVYPDSQTHITLVTFVNFSLHRRVDTGRVAQLQSLLTPVMELIQPLLKRPAFELILNPPVLTRKAAIIPIIDKTGAVASIRQTIRARLETNTPLHNELIQSGLNVPGIIHSTIMRFKSAPANLSQFVADFDTAASSMQPFPLTVNELLLTTETKPYMRQGEIVHRFPLA
jgi:hypothetical protein